MEDKEAEKRLEKIAKSARPKQPGLRLVLPGLLLGFLLPVLLYQCVLPTTLSARYGHTFVERSVLRQTHASRDNPLLDTAERYLLMKFSLQADHSCQMSDPSGDSV